MVPGLIAGHYRFDDCHIDLAALARNAGVRFVQARTTGIDVAQRRAALNNGDCIDYDLASLDVGSTPSTVNVAGAADHAIAVKPFATFSQNWDNLVERAGRGELRNIVVVGGGAAGIEVILAMQYRLAKFDNPTSIRFALVSDAPCVLPEHNDRTRAAVEHLLTARGISMHLNARVERVERNALIFSDAVRIQSDATIWTTGAGAPPWLRDTGLTVDAGGFVTINECLSSVSHPGVFAVGDCASMHGHRYPKSGVYAVRQGPVLAENLRRVLTGKPLMNYRPQRIALSLISTGDKYAVATYGRYSHEGAWVWRWKNYIDRKFMRKYRVDG
jgi:selenide,water dikinase